MYTIYINNTLPPALAVHEIYRDIFGPPMLATRFKRRQHIENITDDDEFPIHFFNYP